MTDNSRKEVIVTKAMLTNKSTAAGVNAEASNQAEAAISDRIGKIATAIANVKTSGADATHLIQVQQKLEQVYAQIVEFNTLNPFGLWMETPSPGDRAPAAPASPVKATAVPKTDSNGKPVYDQFGNQVYVQSAA